MELRVKKIQRGGIGKISLGKFRREAIKTRVNPSVEDSGIGVGILRKRHPKGIRLGIGYGIPVEVAEAYKHIRGYEVLSRDLSSRLDWCSICAWMDVSEDSIFSGKWTLRDRRDDEHCKIGGKTLLWFLVHGDVSRKDELDSYFSKIVESRSYSGMGLKYDGRPVIENSILYLMKEVDEISSDEFLVGEDFAKKWLKPFLTVGRELPEGIKEERSMGGSFIYESRPSSVESILVEMPVSLEKGRGFIAEYAHKLGD